MIADILTRLPLRIPLHPETKFFIELYQLLPGKTVKHLFIIRMNIVHERLQIWRTPLAVQIGITKAKLPFTQQTLKDAFVVNADLTDRPCAWTLRPEDAAISKNKIYSPVLSFLRNAKSGGKITRQIFLPIGGGQDHIVVSRSDWGLQ